MARGRGKTIINMLRCTNSELLLRKLLVLRLLLLLWLLLLLVLLLFRLLLLALLLLPLLLPGGGCYRRRPLHVKAPILICRLEKNPF